jgi:hypothetical protein
MSVFWGTKIFVLKWFGWNFFSKFEKKRIAFVKAMTLLLTM